MREFPSVLLIVPCYNESKRLRLDLFEKELPSWVCVLFADDGSTDQTVQILENFCKKNSQQFLLFRAYENSGKGRVIHKAYLYARAQNWFSSFEWVGFWDADLATSLKEVQNFMTYHREFTPDAKALFGSRINRYGAKVTRNPLRHYLSRVFVTVTDVVLGVRAYDSQCGAKLFRKDICEAVFKEKFVSKWIFDLEIILRVGAPYIVEVPVQAWQDVPGSKVRLGRDSWRLLGDLWSIRKRYMNQ